MIRHPIGWPVPVQRMSCSAGGARTPNRNIRCRTTENSSRALAPRRTATSDPRRTASASRTTKTRLRPRRKTSTTTAIRSGESSSTGSACRTPPAAEWSATVTSASNPPLPGNDDVYDVYDYSGALKQPEIRPREINAADINKTFTQFIACIRTC